MDQSNVLKRNVCRPQDFGIGPQKKIQHGRKVIAEKVKRGEEDDDMEKDNELAESEMYK